ncbi:MAG: SDR family oxidoreductase [Bacteriovoracaceae bacterium]
MKNLVITGATGFLGSELLPKACATYENVYAIVRSKTIEKVREALSIYKNLKLIPGNIENTDVIENIEDRDKIYQLESDFLHVAAYYNIASTKSENYITNIIGTQNIIHFVGQMKKCKSFHYVSSVGVSGNFEGVFEENDLDKKQDFDDFYANSKFDAESIVRNWDTKIPKTVYRPGIIIGHSETGAIKKIDGPYYIFQILHRFKDFDRFKELLGMSKYLPMPYSRTVNIPFVPVDEVADFIIMVLKDKRKFETIQTYHLTGNDGGVNFEMFINQALEVFNYDLRATPLPLSKANDFLGMGLGFPKEILSYMYKECLYSQESIKKNYPQFKFKSFDQYSSKFYDFALNQLFY